MSLMNQLDLSHLTSFMKGHTELRAQENTTTIIYMVNGKVLNNRVDTTRGVSARVCHSGAWGFYSKANLDDESVKEVILKANAHAESLKELAGHHNKELSFETFNHEHCFRTKKSKASQKDKIELLEEIDQYIVTNYPDVEGRSLSLYGLNMQKNMFFSNGSVAKNLNPRCHINFSISKKDKNGETCEYRSRVGDFGEFEDLFQGSKEIFKKIDQAYKGLIDKTESVHADAGEKDVVLGAELAGILAHEAIGHTVEADLVLAGSIAADYYDKKIASELVNMVDFANHYDGKLAPVPVFVDDEGTVAKDANLIENGVLKNFMHNKESAIRLGHEAHGNARAFDYFDEPLIRMRNTAILPGKNKLDDLISSIDDGYYLVTPLNGQADSTSEFMFGVDLGYEIKNGKIGKAIKNTTISGVAVDVLQSVSMLSDDMVWLNSGFCGKKQRMSVGMGGPAIKCKVSLGGR